MAEKPKPEPLIEPDPTPDPPKPVRSPANRGVRTIVAAVFVAIWLIAILYDFFVAPEQDAIPFWFQAAGLVVLGYLLGVSMDDVPGRGGK